MTRLRSALITAGIAATVIAVPVAALALPGASSTPAAPAVEQPAARIAEVPVDQPAADTPAPAAAPQAAPDVIDDQAVATVVVEQPATPVVEAPAADTTVKETPAPAPATVEDQPASNGRPPVVADEPLPETPDNPLDTFDTP